MNITETFTVASHSETHVLRAWPTSLSRTTVSQNATQNSPLGSEIEQERQAEDGNQISQLAPVDGGIAAWRLLGAAFVFETLLW
ncbi:hypothetical protein NW767_014254, partial [Fusarium falciforme]